MHDPVVPVREQALLVSAMLAQAGSMTFHELVEDAATRAVVVSRFLALLELYRRGAVEFDQENALGALTIHWTGTQGRIDIDVDDYSGAGDEDPARASLNSAIRSDGEGDNADE